MVLFKTFCSRCGHVDYFTRQMTEAYICDECMREKKAQEEFEERLWDD